MDNRLEMVEKQSLTWSEYEFGVLCNSLDNEWR